MKILVAPNSFKECASAAKIARIIIEELTKKNFNSITSIPVSDGGDGFLEVCKETFNLRMINYNIQNCFDQNKRNIDLGISIDKKRIFIESADVIGLKTIPKNLRNPLLYGSQNFGILLNELIKSQQRFDELTIGLGGTGTSDLGLGLCVPFGLRLLDKTGKDIPVIPAHYTDAEDIILPERIDSLISVILDVQCSLYGPRGTSNVFARQKGADDNSILQLEKGARNILRLLKNKKGLDFFGSQIGAGGGLSLGLSLLADTQIISSEEFLTKHLHLDEAIQNADVVISGEGSLDDQSFMNKATGIVINKAVEYSKNLFLITGVNKIAELPAGIEVYQLLKIFGNEKEAIRNYETGIRMICKLIAKELEIIKI